MGGGAIAQPTYCVSSVGIRAASTYVLAGEASADKWPHGLDQ